MKLVSRKTLCLVLALAIAGCHTGHLQNMAAAAPDPAQRARLAALAWIRNEYPHDYDGYNALRTDLIDYAVDQGVLASVTSADAKNLDSWRQLVDSKDATEQEVHDAIEFLERLAPTRAGWALHPDSGENDGTHALMIGAAVVIAVAIIYVASGAPLPKSSSSTSSSPTSDETNKKSSPLAGGPSGSGGSASSHFIVGGSTASPAKPTPGKASSGGSAYKGKVVEDFGEDSDQPDPGEKAAADQKAKKDKQKADLAACLANVKSQLPPPHTDPFPVNAFGAAKMELGSCQGQWTQQECLGKVLALLPDVKAMAREVDRIFKDYWDIPGLKQSCPVGDMNSDDVAQVTFWCKNLRKDCGPQMALAEQTIAAANKASQCAWTGGFYKSREDACRKQFGEDAP